MCKHNRRRNTDPKNDQSVDAWKTERTPRLPMESQYSPRFCSFYFYPMVVGLNVLRLNPNALLLSKKLFLLPTAPNKVNIRCFRCIAWEGAMPPKARKEDECRSSCHCVTPGFVQRKGTPKWGRCRWGHLQALAPREHLMGFCHGTGFLG